MSITKGDWVVNRHEKESQWFGNITAELGKVDGIMNIRTIACLTKYCGEDEQEANAELIANAPATLRQRDALLAACEALQKAAVHASNDKKTVLSGQLTNIWMLADTAIASTKGE